MAVGRLAPQAGTAKRRLEFRRHCGWASGEKQGSTRIFCTSPERCSAVCSPVDIEFEGEPCFKVRHLPGLSDAVTIALPAFGQVRGSDGPEAADGCAASLARRIEQQEATSEPSAEALGNLRWFKRRRANLAAGTEPAQFSVLVWHAVTEPPRKQVDGCLTSAALSVNNETEIAKRLRCLLDGQRIERIDAFLTQNPNLVPFPPKEKGTLDDVLEHVGPVFRKAVLAAPWPVRGELVMTAF